MARDGSTQLLVEREGLPVATGRITPPADEVWLGEIAAADPAAAHALLAHAASFVGGAMPWGGGPGSAAVPGGGGRGSGAVPGGELKVKERAGSVGGDALESLLAPRTGQAASYYARVPDVAALLDHLRPVLSARLAASGVDQGSGEAVVSFFRHHVRLAYKDGTVGEVRPGGPMQAPAAVAGAGVAPDLVGPLLFGPCGIAGLAERHPDVYPGPNRELMSALFPPLSADLLTFYLP